MVTPAPTAQDEAERVLAQIEAALRVAEKVEAPPEVIDDLRAIHRRLHQAGLRHDHQAASSDAEAPRERLKAGASPASGRSARLRL